MGCSHVFSHRKLVFFVVAMAVLSLAQGVLAANYEFLAAPETDLNRVYRLDRATGEIGACQYGLKEASVGVRTRSTDRPEGRGEKRTRAAQPSSAGRKRWSGGDHLYGALKE